MIFVNFLSKPGFRMLLLLPEQAKLIEVVGVEIVPVLAAEAGIDVVLELESCNSNKYCTNNLCFWWGRIFFIEFKEAASLRKSKNALE